MNSREPDPVPNREPRESRPDPEYEPSAADVVLRMRVVLKRIVVEGKVALRTKPQPYLHTISEASEALNETAIDIDWLAEHPALYEAAKEELIHEHLNQ
jgi:hypothetical protein